MTYSMQLVLFFFQERGDSRLAGYEQANNRGVKQSIRETTGSEYLLAYLPLYLVTLRWADRVTIAIPDGPNLVGESPILRSPAEDDYVQDNVSCCSDRKHR